MLYTIENDQIRVQVASRGAELQSIVRKADGTEYLWQGDPTYWSDRALNLFPIVGRLWNGVYTYKGKTYEMNIHGFLWTSEVPVVEQTQDKIVFRLVPDEAILAQYPFQFELTVTHALVENSIMTTMHVVNRDEKDLIFGVGFHPGFNVPLDGQGAFSDYCLEFDEPAEVRSFVMSPTCFMTPASTKLPLVDGKVLPLRHNLFDNDALVLTDVCRGVTLRSAVSERSVHVEYPQMGYLGIWHAPKTEAPYVCIEPWSSIPSDDGRVDDLESKRAMVHLPQGETYDNSCVITIR